MAATAFVNLLAKLNISGVNTSAETLMLCRKHHVSFGPVQLGRL